MNTSQKHRNFVAEPMRDKPITELPGIGPVLGERLKRRGYVKAHQLMAQYLLLGKNKQRFQDWMMKTCGANPYQSGTCFQCLSIWCDEFV